MRLLDLFSGIGGFSLGMERAGMVTVAFCEIEDYPVSILNKHWPSVPVHRDIRKLDGKQFFNKIDILCGGFPCQPYSVAGQQKGEEDDRHLWPEMFRIVKESRPTWVVAENVAGFITMALDDVLLDLETEGYTTQSFVIPACAVGGVHKRDRVWIIGYAEHNGRYGSENGQGDTSGNDRNQKGKDKIIKTKGSSCKGRDDADTDNQGLQGTSSSRNIESKRPNAEQLITGLRDTYRPEFKPIGIPTQPPVCHRDNGLPDRVARLKALGNAVVPQVPEIIGRAIIEIESKILKDLNS